MQTLVDVITVTAVIAITLMIITLALRLLEKTGWEMQALVGTIAVIVVISITMMMIARVLSS